jgi:hypothetical protein
MERGKNKTSAVKSGCRNKKDRNKHTQKKKASCCPPSSTFVGRIYAFIFLFEK